MTKDASLIYSFAVNHAHPIQDPIARATVRVVEEGIGRLILLCIRDKTLEIDRSRLHQSGQLSLDPSARNDILAFINKFLSGGIIQSIRTI